MTCRTSTTHHAYPDGAAHVPCCGVHIDVIWAAGEVITTDPAKVTCGGGE